MPSTRESGGPSAVAGVDDPGCCLNPSILASSRCATSTTSPSLNLWMKAATSTGSLRSLIAGHNRVASVSRASWWGSYS